MGKNNVLNDIQAAYKNYMPSETYINVLDYSTFNYKKFNEKYMIREITRTDEKEYFGYDNKLLDAFKDNPSIVSKYYSGGRSAYFLIDRTNISLFDGVIEEIMKNDNYKERIVAVDENGLVQGYLKDIMLNLMLNGLAKRFNSDLDNHYAFNLSGQLLVHFERNISRGEEITMAYSVKDGCLVRGMKTFTNKAVYEAAHKKTNTESENKDKKSKPALYKLSEGKNGTIFLERVFDETKVKEKELYVNRSLGKHTSKYDNLKQSERTKTRTILFNKLVENFNFEYEDIYTLNFVKVNTIYSKIDATSTSIKTPNAEGKVTVKEDKRLTYIKELPKINIVTKEFFSEKNNLRKNNKKNKYEKKFRTVELYTERLCDILQNYFELEVSVSEDLDENACNIILHHDKDAYRSKSENDVKKAIDKENMICQSFTYETLDDCEIELEKTEEKNKKSEKKDEDIYTEYKNKLYQALSECKIKKEIINRKFSEWNFGKMEFYCGIRRKNIVDNDIHVLLRVEEDGSMDFIYGAEKIHNAEMTKKLSRLTGRDGTYIDGSICIVKKDEDMNEIRHTGLYTLPPDKDAIKKTMPTKEGSKLRSRAAEYLEDRMIYPYFGKNILVYDNELYYYVGEDRGINTSIATNPNLYKIEPLEKDLDEESEYILEIFDLLRNPFARSSTTETVRPFPFKYILEYVRAKEHSEDIRL